ncbi:MAG: ComF family protein [Patescibacteria group bacterium]
MPPSTDSKSYPQSIRDFLWDTLFPKRCLACRKESSFLCSECLLKISMRLEQVCPYCEKITTPQGQICPSCRERKLCHLDSLSVVSSYKNPLDKLVHSFKYNFLEELTEVLGKLIIDFVRNSNLEIPDLITPVPLHSFRLRWRGFNQSFLLAKKLGDELTPGFPLPAYEILQRTRWSSPQMKLSGYRERQSNARGIFCLTNPSAVQGLKILLIDDISTTGATLFECAKVLKEGGARKVSALVLARQEINP